MYHPAPAVKRDDLSHVETHRFVALTGALLFVQDKSAPRYIQIYTNEQ